MGGLVGGKLVGGLVGELVGWLVVSWWVDSLSWLCTQTKRKFQAI